MSTPLPLPYDDPPKQKHCEHCGAKVLEYRHNLGKGLLAGLVALYRRGGSAKLNDLGLTLNESNNFQKLRYWDLIEKGKHGIWTINYKGTLFIQGEIRVPRTARTFRGKRVGYEGGHVRVSDVIKDFNYRKLEDYTRDSVRHEL